jgi:nicotinate-nucleotide adenylyltransferase
MCAKERIALYGGTFDPVHIGHLEVARRVQELFEIEKVLFVPAQVAPHKIGKPVTAPWHRYAMLALATQEDPKIVVSSFELEAPDRCYTVNTVAHFLEKLGDRNELFFVMGADSWSEIKTWRHWEQLLTMVNHIVVTRPGYEIDDYTEVKQRLVDLRTGKLPSSRSSEGDENKIFVTDAVVSDISATEIRALAGAGRFEELTRLVSAPVANYLKKYRIYQESNET